jgi:cupin fold WbuC family metalloprotein
MLINNVPVLIDAIMNEFHAKAINSVRKRSAYHLHENGDYLNQSFNWILKDSYMQPHCHASVEKIEQINLVKGELDVIFFNNLGNIIKVFNLNLPKRKTIVVPAFQYHTYIVKTDFAVTFETMESIYDPKDWKQFPNWAPQEGKDESLNYFEKLRSKIG